MATNKLLDDAGLTKLLTLLKAKFPLITSLATINGLSLVNGGNDIEIKGDKDVCFFEGDVTLSSTVTNGSGTGAIKWRASSKTFVSVSGSTQYNNFAGGDDYGDLTANGRTPVLGKLYIDTVSRKFYYWDTSDLVCLTVDTSLYKVVTTLPTASADTENKIYLVTGSKTASGNTYAEHITVKSGSTYKWEKLGEHHTNVVLDGYATEDWVGRNYVPDTILGDERYFNEQPSTGTITGDLSQLNNQVYALQYSVLSTEAAQALVDATFK